jgi:ribosome-associated protein
MARRRPDDTPDLASDPDLELLERPSKGQRKREMEALLHLADKLVTLSEKQLDHLDLSEELRDAIRLSRKITHGDAHRRHLQFIRRLLESLDPEPLHKALEQWGHGVNPRKK